MSEESGFKVIPLQNLIMDSEGKAGIPFDVLRKEFGFTVMVKGPEIYIKAPEGINKELGQHTNIGVVCATDNFSKDSDILKNDFGFKDYYQGSLIYSSVNRGIKRYDIIITGADDWYNVSVKGDYETGCNIYNGSNTILELVKFYFPISYEEIIKGLLEGQNIRKKYDERDTLIRNYDLETKELVFSVAGGNLE